MKWKKDPKTSGFYWCVLPLTHLEKGKEVIYDYSYKFTFIKVINNVNYSVYDLFCKDDIIGNIEIISKGKIGEYFDGYDYMFYGPLHICPPNFNNETFKLLTEDEYESISGYPTIQIAEIVSKNWLLSKI